MAPLVTGSVFGRMGMKSLKEGLKQLGFAPCHDMHEIIILPSRLRIGKQSLLVSQSAGTVFSPATNPRSIGQGSNV